MHGDPPTDMVGDPTSALVSPAHAFIFLYSRFYLFITIFTIVVTSHVASETAQSPELISAWVFFLFNFWPDALTTGKILRVLWPKCLARFRVGNTMNSPVESAQKSALSKASWGSMLFIVSMKTQWKSVDYSGLGKGLLGSGFSQTHPCQTSPGTASSFLPSGCLTLTSSFGSLYCREHSNTPASCFRKTPCAYLAMCRLWIWWLIANISAFKVLLILLSTIRKYFKITILLTVKAIDIKTKPSSPQASGSWFTVGMSLHNLSSSTHMWVWWVWPL